MFTDPDGMESRGIDGSVTFNGYVGDDGTGNFVGTTQGDKPKVSTTSTNSNVGTRLLGTTNDNQGWGLGFNLSLTAGTFGFDATLPYANFSVMAQISEVVVYGVNENGTIIGGKDSQGKETIIWGASGGADLARGTLPLSGGYSQENTRQNGSGDFSVSKQEASVGYSSFTAKGTKGSNTKTLGSEVDIFKVKAGFGMGIELGAKVDVPQFLTKFANTVSGGVYSTHDRTNFMSVDATRVNNKRVYLNQKKP